MSTYWGYVCKSHDPELTSEQWFNHGEAVLREAFELNRAGRWPIDPASGMLEEPMPVISAGGYETLSPIHWLREHPNCQVALRDEYGVEQSLGPTVNGSVTKKLDPGVLTQGPSS